MHAAHAPRSTAMLTRLSHNLDLYCPRRPNHLSVQTPYQPLYFATIDKQTHCATKQRRYCTRSPLSSGHAAKSEHLADASAHGQAEHRLRKASILWKLLRFTANCRRTLQTPSFRQFLQQPMGQHVISLPSVTQTPANDIVCSHSLSRLATPGSTQHDKEEQPKPRYRKTAQDGESRIDRW